MTGAQDMNELYPNASALRLPQSVISFTDLA